MAALTVQLALASLAFSTLGPPVAHAELVRVERDDGAASCPDGEQLAARLASLRPNEQVPSTARYSVHFASLDGALTATIFVASGVDANERVRVLDGRGHGCEVLAQATAVALALMLDADAQNEPRQALATLPAPNVPASPRVESRAAPSTRAVLLLGGGAMLGVTQPIIPVFQAQVGITRGRYHVDVGALGAPVQRFDFGPGSLREWLLAGSARGCVAAYRAHRLSMGTCAGAYVGVLDARARGYTRNAQRKQLWAALPIELFVAYSRSPFAFELAAAALVPLRRPDFSVEGLGPAYQSWPVALSLFVRVSASFAVTFEKK